MMNSLLSSLVHFPFTHLRLPPAAGNKSRILLPQIKKLQELLPIQKIKKLQGVNVCFSHLSR